MDDLISRAAAIDAIECLRGGCITDDVKNFTTFQVLSVPAVDAVPVVRCRDCKYGEPDTNGCGEDMVMCQNKQNPIGDGDWLMPLEFYCADGERRDEA